MVEQIKINKNIRQKLSDYILDKVITRWDKQTIYPKWKREIPKTQANNRLLDFRKMFVDSIWLELISNIFWDYYENEFPFQIASIELWSVPLMWALLMEWKRRWLNVDWIIVRKSRKKSWLWNIIEWTPQYWKLILVDDIVNSWLTLSQSIEILNDNNIPLSKIFCIVNFESKKLGNNLEIESWKISIDYVISTKELWLKKLDDWNDIYRVFAKKTQVLCLSNPNKVLVVFKSSPLIDEENIYFWWEWWEMFCIDKNSFLVKWKFKVNLSKRMKNILSSPYDLWDSIIFWSYDWTLYKLRKTDWKQMFYSSIADWIWSSPDYSKKNDSIYVWLEHYWNYKWSLACLSNKDWEVKWNYYVDDYIHSSPIYIKENNTVICWSNCWKLLCLDADSWEKKWITEFSAPIKSWFKYSIKNNSVYFWCFDYNFYSVNLNTWEINWKVETWHIIYWNPCVYKDEIFFWSIDRYFYHVDKDWKILYKYLTWWRIFAEPVIYNNDYILFPSNDMRIYFYNIKKRAVNMYIQHSERITNKIWVWENKLYVLDFMNRFYIFDMTKLTYSKPKIEHDEP